MSSEPTIICPSCQTEIKLTESLAAPLIASTKRDFEKRLAEQDARMQQKELALRQGEESLAKAKESLDEQVAEKLKKERSSIAADEAKKARAALSLDLDQKSKEITELQDVLKAREEKLAEAQKAQAELIRKQRELDDAIEAHVLADVSTVRSVVFSKRRVRAREAEEPRKPRAPVPGSRRYGPEA